MCGRGNEAGHVAELHRAGVHVSMGEQRVQLLLGGVWRWNADAHGDVCGAADDGDRRGWAVFGRGDEAGDVADVQPAGVPDVRLVGGQLRRLLGDLWEWNADAHGDVRPDWLHDTGG